MIHIKHRNNAYANKSSQDLLPGVHRAVRGRAVLPGSGRCGLQAVLQQRELRGLDVRVHAAAALPRVFSLRVLALRFRLILFNQESLLFGCCCPWAGGNIATANW